MGDANATVPFVICPPSAPPPNPPPDFGSWSAQIPAWFWLMFTFTMLTTVLSGAALAYTAWQARAARRDMAMLGARGTNDALTRLEARVLARVGEI